MYTNSSNTLATKRILLSDNNQILLKERSDYIEVYQINRFVVKKLGEIDETYFSNDCLSSGKYQYEYDESEKKLTIICEYGTYGDSVVHLKKEYDTGFWSEEFLIDK